MRGFCVSCHSQSLQQLFKVHIIALFFSPTRSLFPHPPAPPSHICVSLSLSGQAYFNEFNTYSLIHIGSYKISLPNLLICHQLWDWRGAWRFIRSCLTLSFHFHSRPMVRIAGIVRSERGFWKFST